MHLVSFFLAQSAIYIAKSSDLNIQSDPYFACEIVATLNASPATDGNRIGGPTVENGDWGIDLLRQLHTSYSYCYWSTTTYWIRGGGT